MIRVQQEDAIFENFELSSQSGAVLECEGGLRRFFSADAVLISNFVFNDSHFRQELIHLLRKLNIEYVKKMTLTAKKAEHKSTESRDTINLRLVTEMLMTILTFLNHFVFVSQIHKRIRDDVI